MNFQSPFRMLLQFIIVTYICVVAQNNLFTTGISPPQNGQFNNGEYNETYIDLPFKVLNITVSTISCSSHSLIVDTNGTLFGIGRNNRGQLGLNDTLDRVKLIEISFFQNLSVFQVATGLFHSLVLTKDNLYSFGLNFHGQLGIGKGVNLVVLPSKIDIEDIKISSIHSFKNTAGYLSYDGNLYLFGEGSQGQIGVGGNNLTNHYVPIKVLEKVLKFCMGDSYSVAINTTNHILGTGMERNNEIGLGPIAPLIIESPTEIPNLYGITKISTNSIISLAYHKRKKIIYSLSGLLGFDFKKPTPIYGPMRKALKVRTGFDVTFVFTLDSKIYAFGDNSLGQLGLGHQDPVVLPIETNYDFDLKDVTMGWGVTFYKTNSTIYSSGTNNFGETGSNLPYGRPILNPSRVPIENITECCSGQWFSIFVQNKRRIYIAGTLLGNFNYLLTLLSSVEALTNDPNTNILIKQMICTFKNVHILLDDGRIFSMGSDESIQILNNGTSRYYFDMIHFTIENKLYNRFNSLIDGFFLFSWFVQGLNNEIIEIGKTGMIPKILNLNYTKANGGFQYAFFINQEKQLLAYGQPYPDLDFNLGLGDVNLVSSPQAVPNFINIKEAYGGHRVSFFINTCENNFTGQNCDQYTCQGFDPNEDDVCSGLGTCIAHNLCQCPYPFFGNQCEFSKEFHFLNLSNENDWISKNWHFKDEFDYIKTKQNPGLLYEDVILGSFNNFENITFNIKNDVKIGKIIKEDGKKIILNCYSSLISIKGDVSNITFLNGIIKLEGKSKDCRFINSSLTISNQTMNNQFENSNIYLQGINIQDSYFKNSFIIVDKPSIIEYSKFQENITVNGKTLLQIKESKINQSLFTAQSNIQFFNSQITNTKLDYTSVISEKVEIFDTTIDESIFLLNGEANLQRSLFRKLIIESKDDMNFLNSVVSSTIIDSILNINSNFTLKNSSVQQSFIISKRNISIQESALENSRFDLKGNDYIQRSVLMNMTMTSNNTVEFKDSTVKLSILDAQGLVNLDNMVWISSNFTQISITNIRNSLFKFSMLDMKGNTKIENLNSEESFVSFKEVNIYNSTWTKSKIQFDKKVDLDILISKESTMEFNGLSSMVSSQIERSTLSFNSFGNIQRTTFSQLSNLNFFNDSRIQESNFFNSEIKMKGNILVHSCFTKDSIFTNEKLFEVQDTVTHSSYFNINGILQARNISLENSKLIYKDKVIMSSLSSKNSDVSFTSSIVTLDENRNDLIEERVLEGNKLRVNVEGDLTFKYLYLQDSIFKLKSSTSIQSSLISRSSLTFEKETTLKNSKLDNTDTFYYGITSLQETNVSNSKSFHYEKVIFNQIVSTNSIHNIYKDIDVRKSFMINSTIKNELNSIYRQIGDTQSTNSKLENDGMILVNTTKDVYFIIDIINNNEVHIAGEYKTFLSHYVQSMDAILFLNNSKLIMLNSSLEIYNGSTKLSGYIEAKRFYYGSTSIFKLQDPQVLFMNGDCFFDERSIIFLNLYGQEIEKNERITVNGTLSLNSYLYFKVGFGVSINTKIAVFQFQKLVTLQSLNVLVSGLIYRGGVIEESNKILYLKIIYSFGSVEQKGYKCTYLGKQKVLEINNYVSQKKITLTLTVPKRNNVRLGFGFDVNNMTEILALSNYDNTKTTLFSHQNKNSIPAYDLQIYETQSIFQIGPTYFTLFIFVDSKYLESQQFIYYSEIPINSTQSSNNSFHYIEKFPFKVLSSSQTDCTNFLQPTRAEIYSYPVAIVVLIVYSIIFIFTFLFRNRNPLLSRGIDPYLTLIFISVQMGLEFRNLGLITEFQSSLCFYLAYGIYPLQTICFFINFYYFCRYFSIINLSEKRRDYIRRMKHETDLKVEMTYFTKVLKILSSKYLTAGMVIVTYLILLIIYSIIIGSFKGECSFQALVALNSVQYSLMIIVYLLTLATFIVDLIINFNLIKELKIIKYIFNSDPYYFRAQALIYCPFMAFSLGSGIYLLSTSTNFADIIKHHEAGMVINTINSYLLLGIDVLFPLIITIISFLRELSHKRQVILEGSIEMIMANESLSEMFLEFCCSEFTEENVLCYMDIEAFKKNHLNNPYNELSKVTYKEKEPNAVEIYTRYFNGLNSVFQVNVPQKDCSFVLEKMKNYKNTQDPSLFDDLLKIVKQNICENSFLTFKRSPEYKNFMETNNLQREMIEGKK